VNAEPPVADNTDLEFLSAVCGSRPGMDHVPYAQAKGRGEMNVKAR
jgi:hypothetical protein